MIDELGLKGLSVGDARVSDRHANFFVNAGNASAQDMLALIADVRQRVERTFSVTLEHEVVVWNASRPCRATPPQQTPTLIGPS
jgi:UDP-N-acetylmuramate dehydrogenase